MHKKDLPSTAKGLGVQSQARFYNLLNSFLCLCQRVKIHSGWVKMLSVGVRHLVVDKMLAGDVSALFAPWERSIW